MYNFDYLDFLMLKFTSSYRWKCKVCNKSAFSQKEIYMHVHKSHGKKSRSTTEDQFRSDEDNLIRTKSNTSNEVNMTDTNAQGIYFDSFHLESNTLMLILWLL